MSIAGRTGQAVEPWGRPIMATCVRQHAFNCPADFKQIDAADIGGAPEPLEQGVDAIPPIVGASHGGGRESNLCQQDVVRTIALNHRVKILAIVSH